MREDYISPGPKRTFKLVAVKPEVIKAADALATVCKGMKGYFPLSDKLNDALAAYEKVRDAK